ncbi:hypothetical protein OF829_12635 [Sphingomonas sp. LB-2]|uniref:trypco2 family protein n=1 Tax=Sphingomonas caeni TaxID=2984949 RepID=UPI00222FF75A|nr:trypco2 family protein [Sphingomonas caeni]MCW3848089.1 hypothetical protein [Sphingomonas caeni]
MQDLIPLAEAIGALRTQLSEAQTAGQNEAIRFEVGTVEVEFQAVVEREASAEATLGFKIFGLGSEAKVGGKLGDARTQSVKITLVPKRNGRSLEIADREQRQEQVDLGR